MRIGALENLAGIVAFVRTVSSGSFIRAAQSLGVSSAAVSKNLQRLEKSLGVRLLNRTTRKIALTDEGALYFEQCKPAVQQLQQAAAALRDARGAPRGRLRVSATVGFGRLHIAPLLPEFLNRYPDIELDFLLDDHVADLVEDRIDVAIRNGRLADRDIVARRLAPMRLVVCGSPDYLARNGTPLAPEDLANHSCINFFLAASGKAFPWEFERDGERFTMAVGGSLTANDAETVCDAALKGLGLAQIGTYQAVAPIRARRLKAVLLDYTARERGHYLCYLSRKHLPQRIRAFADFIVQRIDPARFSLPSAATSTRKIRRVADG
ncbi:MAG: LysR family transcriptional regulator [Burkholderiales bacterium]